MDHSIVGSAIKPWIRKAILRNTLKPSTFHMFSPTNALNAPLYLAPGKLCETIKIESTQKINIHCVIDLWKNKVIRIIYFDFTFTISYEVKYFNDSGQITNPQDLDQYILTSEDGSYYCGICHQAMRDRSNIKRHIESKHFPNVFSYQCPECPHVVGTKRALQRHRERIHPKHWLMGNYYTCIVIIPLCCVL